MKDISILLKIKSDIIKISQQGCSWFSSALEGKYEGKSFKLPIIVSLNEGTNEYEEILVEDKCVKNTIDYVVQGCNAFETNEAIQYIVKNRFLFKGTSKVYIGEVKGLDCVSPVIIAVDSKRGKKVILYVFIKGYIEQFTLQYDRYVEEKVIEYFINNSKDVTGYAEFLSWLVNDEKVKYDTVDEMLFKILYLFPDKYIDHLAKITSSIFIGEVCPSGYSSEERELYAINTSTMSCVNLSGGIDKSLFDSEDSKGLHKIYINFLKEYGLAYQGGILCTPIGIVDNYYTVYALNKKFFLAVNISALLKNSYIVYKVLVFDKDFAKYAIQSRETLLKDINLLKEYKQEIRSLYGFKDCLN